MGLSAQVGGTLESPPSWVGQAFVYAPFLLQAVAVDFDALEEHLAFLEGFDHGSRVRVQGRVVSSSSS